MPPADALLKKLSRGGAARPPLPETDALGPAFARGVEDRLRPILGALVAAQAEAPRAARLGEAAAAVTPPALVGVAELPGAELPAVVAADFALAWHMTDLTLGADPTGAPSPLARPLTAIDFALGRLHLEAILAALGPALGAGLGRPLPGPLRLAQARQDWPSCAWGRSAATLWCCASGWRSARGADAEPSPPSCRWARSTPCAPPRAQRRRTAPRPDATTSGAGTCAAPSPPPRRRSRRCCIVRP